MTTPMGEHPDFLRGTFAGSHVLAAEQHIEHVESILSGLEREPLNGEMARRLNTRLGVALKLAGAHADLAVAAATAELASEQRSRAVDAYMRGVGS